MTRIHKAPASLVARMTDAMDFAFEDLLEELIRLKSQPSARLLDELASPGLAGVVDQEGTQEKPNGTTRLGAVAS